MKAKRIANKLKKEGRSIAWLASQIGITRFHLHNILNGRANLTKENLTKINKILNTNY